MSFKPLSSFRRGFGVFWRAVDSTRRGVLNVLFLVIVVVLLMAIFGGGIKPIAKKTALVVEIKGSLVEQHSGNVREALMANVGAGEVRKSVQLRDVLTVLDNAAKDPQISSVLLLLDQMDGAGLAMLNEVGLAIERVKASGKPVIAWGSSFDQRQYSLASHASQVYLHPMGAVMIEGFGRYRNYYRDALDKVGVTVNLMKVGTYKSFAEPYIGNGPSPAAAEADAFLYNALWAGYTADVEKNRKLPAGWIAQRIANLPALMEEAGGDTGKLSLTSKLVDGLKTRDEIRAMMIARGAPDDDGKSFRQVAFDEYLMRMRPALMGDGVGVIVAAGEISDGNAPAGAIGGLSTANLIRKAREDKQIKAVVLRVDSPGGSAFGSELIRRELELTRAAGKPVVVSMGSVAASGGYWISMASDEVFADRATITGSIGVFAILPTAEKVVDKLGIHSAGVTTTWLADAYNPMRPLDPRFAQLIQSSVNHIYSDFTTKAAAARKTTQPKIDEVGQGRVWTGVQAKERGLVDTIGSYTDALKSAARRAKLADGYRVAYIERDIPPFERVLTMFGASAAQAVNIEVKLGLMPTGLPSSAVAEVSKELGWLSDMTQARKPFSAITHCMCTAP
ncbi:signal peptide peptidase SppA [Massilia antarctica]|uniref:Signal peptide peptidase SppA n=1 Tax=Massilia antarctica TaxID=2765360 RepID=A0AA49A7Q5_9BURK|nr:signal peptide peptidase SppA [Massilia antarctica]QPI49683.1 signal peptide peptidase SppA [Massilia antarctica]